MALPTKCSAKLVPTQMTGPMEANSSGSWPLDTIEIMGKAAPTTKSATRRC